MAININIDNQLALQYSFKIAGAKRDLTFTDECALDLEKVQLEVGKITDEINKLDDTKIDEEDVESQLGFISDLYAKIRNAIIPFFDKYFGDNAGKDIYEYCHESTRALSVVFGKVASYLDKVEVTSSKVVEYKK
ncbi:hypothetical protein [Companilactobacillus mishanensis]|uniref:Uncharacterized protein n=1 Tax=Companilactobacillus mishanensis TaxID=2486008 RepID=A0A5P0ZF32_9LACO|nr:hypothetical protein [Companilactobacillus mishanensis]MQS44242.1 hypothetical protein [Companilactobacillus mishanensis]MQS51653.1 hypothetical protein [Companilactobacillus mishanensis]